MKIHSSKLKYIFSRLHDDFSYVCIIVQGFAEMETLSIHGRVTAPRRFCERGHLSARRATSRYIQTVDV